MSRISGIWMPHPGQKAAVPGIVAAQCRHDFEKVCMLGDRRHTAGRREAAGINLAH